MANSAAIVPAPSQNPKRSTLRMSTSRLRATAGSVELVLSMSNRVGEIRIVSRYKGALRELPEKEREPDATDADRSRKVEPVQGESGRGEDRADQPEEIDHAHRDDQQRDSRQNLRVSVGARRHHQQEREEKMQDDQGNPEPAPSSLQTFQVPGDLLGKVACPDDQILRKGNVGPEHDEGEEELAQIVPLLGGEGARERFVAREQNGDRDHEREAAESLAGDQHHAVHRREPVRLERHDPVNRPERDRQTVGHETSGREQLQPPVQTFGGRAILFVRPPVQEVHEQAPGGQIQNSAADEEGDVQIRSLVLQDRVAQDLFRTRPLVEALQAEEERYEEEGDQGKRPRRGLERPPDWNAPRAAGHSAQHQDRQASERDAGPEDAREEVGPEELLRGSHGSDREGHESHHAGGEQRTPSP